MAPLPRPQDVLDDWIGAARDSAEAADEKNKLWFTKSFATDSYLAETYLDLLVALANGVAEDWAAQGARPRLAAIIALDQFSRNIFRDSGLSFRHDRLALDLCKHGLNTRQDEGLSEAERIFFYLPLEHSEQMSDQEKSVACFSRLLEAAREPFKPLCENTLNYAIRHRDVIEQFGRFPHRNTLLRRRNTPEEIVYLAQPGAGF